MKAEHKTTINGAYRATNSKQESQQKLGEVPTAPSTHCPSQNRLVLTRSRVGVGCCGQLLELLLAPLMVVCAQLSWCLTPHQYSTPNPSSFTFTCRTTFLLRHWERTALRDAVELPIRFICEHNISYLFSGTQFPFHHQPNRLLASLSYSFSCCLPFVGGII